MNEKTNLAEDPKLTAYALGELEGDERAAVEARLHADSAARAAVEEIRALAARLEAALGAEPVAEAGRTSEVGGQMPETGSPKTEAGGRKPEDGERRMGGESVAGPEERKAAIIAGGDLRKLDGGPLRGELGDKAAKAKLLRFPQVYFLVGGLAAAAFAVLVALHEPGHAVREEARSYREVSLAKVPETAPLNVQAVNAAAVGENKTSEPPPPAEFAIPPGLLDQVKKTS